MIPGIRMSGSEMLTQKCGVTDRLHFKQKTADADVFDGVIFSFPVRREVRDLADTSGVGTVDITASAGTKPFGVATPVTRSRFDTMSSTVWKAGFGHRGTRSPQSASTSV